jgi:hypothetical protein
VAALQSGIASAPRHQILKKKKKRKIIHVLSVFVQSSLYAIKQGASRSRKEEPQGGKSQASALTSIWSLSISERTQPIDPSPLQIRIRNGSKCRNNLNLSVTEHKQREATHKEKRKKKRRRYLRTRVERGGEKKII